MKQAVRIALSIAATTSLAFCAMRVAAAPQASLPSDEGTPDLRLQAQPDVVVLRSGQLRIGKSTVALDELVGALRRAGYGKDEPIFISSESGQFDAATKRVLTYLYSKGYGRSMYMSERKAEIVK